MLPALAFEAWNRSMVIDVYNFQYYENENMDCVCNVVATLTLIKQVQESQFTR